MGAAGQAFAQAASNLRRWREAPQLMVRELFGVEPDAWQDEVLEAFPTSPRLCMKAPLSVDAEVWTPTGKRRWGDIRAGDMLFADDGMATTVLRRFDVKAQPLYRVLFRDGTSLRVCGMHEWKVQTRYDRIRETWRVVSTCDLLKMRLKENSGQRIVNIPVQQPAQFSAASLSTDPYLFGLWLGDGIANEPRIICPDHGIRNALRDRGHPIRESVAVPKRIGISGWITALRATGAATCRSYEKFIPKIFKMASVQQRLDLLRGLMDSDGTCAPNGHTYLASCSERLIDDFMWLARSLGYLATRMGPYKINGGNNRDSFRAVICGPICPFLADTSKKRQWRVPREGKYARFIDRIEPDGIGDAMCVEVSNPSHCFQATDFIVTHNCKGPGKTAVLAWLGWNFMLTRPHPIIGATSTTGDNLKSNLWTEFARWREKSDLIKQMFEMTKTEVFNREHPKTWKMEARSWAKDADADAIGNALSGLHAQFVMWLLDETGDYPDAILPTCEAIFAGNPEEAHIVQAGNPIRLSGPLYRACTSARALWKVIEITGDPDDPKRTPRISLQHAREQIDLHGRDNPWIMINILGQFPPQSLNALIGPDEVRAAMNRMYREFELEGSAKVLAADVARQGDDQSVISKRRGLQMFPFLKYRNIDGLQGASVMAREWDEFGADAAFVDATGGFGWTWIDQLRRLGRQPIPVEFAGNAHEKNKFFNKRTEMAFDLVDWIRRGGALPNDSRLLAALTETTYFPKGDRMLLEPKEQVKVKLGYSPDEMDACFVAGTRIATPSGDVPIERLRKGDIVLTPFGTSRIGRTWRLHSNRLTTVTFSNGSVIKGTPDHEIFSFCAGKARLDAITFTMAVSTLAERKKWKILSALFIGARSTGFKKLAGIIPPGNQTSVSAFCIAASGLRLMDLFRKASSSITSTATGATILWKIFRQNCPATIPATIWPHATVVPSLRKRTEGICWKFKMRLQNGIAAMKASIGTGITDGDVPIAANRGPSFVPIVGCSFKANFTQAEIAFARTPASKKTPTENIRTICGSVPTAARNFLLTKGGKQSVVLVDAATENVPPTPVYNLTLERDNAFYAEGVLVFNCMMTLAEPIAPAARKRHVSHSAVAHDYDPFAGHLGAQDAGYDPYSSR